MYSTLAILSGLLTFITFTTTVTAHGFVQGIVTGHKWYPGAQPWWRVNPSIPHAKTAGWSSLNQDLGFISPSEYNTAAIACHKSAKSTNTRIPVNAGDKVRLLWSEWPSSHKGPVLTYLAKCPGDCSIVDPTTLDWFKIDQAGLINGNPAPGYVSPPLSRSANSLLTSPQHMGIRHPHRQQQLLDHHHPLLFDRRLLRPASRNYRSTQCRPRQRSPKLPQLYQFPNFWQGNC
jgi:cellulase